MRAAAKIPRRAAQAGMTLVEILVAMTVLGFLVLAMGGGLRLALRSWDAVERRQDEAGDLILIHRLLGRMLSEAYPVVKDKKNIGSTLAFEGGAQRLAFVAATSPRFGGGGLAWVVLTLEQGAKGKVLTMTRESFFAAEAGEGRAAQGVQNPAREERVLLEGIAQARFAYFGAPDGDEQAAWQDAWTDESALPMLVKVDVEFARGERRTWPDLVAALPVMGEGACEYDAATRRCANRSNSN
jgi:general secretion pathway protein J